MVEFALKIAATVFILVALLHGARLFLKAQVKINEFIVPLWMSIIGIIVALTLAWLMLRAA